MEGTRTKIICTIGPSVDSVEKILELIATGMNGARLNFSHGTHEDHERVIKNLKEARDKAKVPLAIILDTKGPEIRLGKLKEDVLFVNSGDSWTLFYDTVEGDKNGASIRPSTVLNDLDIGMRVLFDDGYIAAKVVQKNVEGVVLQFENGGLLKSGKGVNIPNALLSLPAVTEKDIEDIKFGCKQDIDVIAASFVRSADHVMAIKHLLMQENRPDILVYAKIENSEGVQNFDSIVQIADGIMVARGDLGVEVPLSQVPSLQKMMIRKSYLAGKPVVTATQMLESMIHNPRPTRAEASDVANAVYDSTSSVMLSGETAIGKYPLHAVSVMKSIVKEAENEFNYHNFFDFHADLVYHDVPSAVTLATVKTGYSSGAKAIFIFTKSGSTARLISRLRPQMPIVAMTPNLKCYHQMALNWGVIPYLNDEAKSLTDAMIWVSDFSLKQGIVSYGDLVVVTSGSPFGIAGTTNMMLVESIGDVLIRAHHGVGKKTHGNITVISSADAKKPFAVRGLLIVLTKCDASFLPLIKEAAGVILQNHIDDVESEKQAIAFAEEFNKPTVVRADAASLVLKEGQLVTLDPEKALIYKGVVL